MRFIIIFSFLSAMVFADSRPDLVILYQFDNSYSKSVFRIMRAEVSNVLAKTGLAIDWQAQTAESFPPTPAQLIIIRFRGRCTMDGLIAPTTRDTGPLAVTHAVNGQILPFSDVNCDVVRSNVRAAMPSYRQDNADLFLGRALGRVLTHELWHILSKSETHGREGVTRRCLSPEQLTADHIGMLEQDLERIMPKRPAVVSDAQVEAGTSAGHSAGQF